MSPESFPFNTLLVLLSLVAGVALLRSRATKTDLWHATLTPLSSIIGSGFLIMAPLLASIVGPLSPIAIVAIVLIAFSAGHVIRFNIRFLEPRLAEGRLLPGTKNIEQLGNLVLAFAYVVAVAFYLSLLSSFLLNYFGVSSLFLERSLTTSIIVFITTVGYLRGLGGLERLEAFSVNIQLAVIASLMVGLALFSLSFYSSSELDIEYTLRPIPVQFQMLAGALLIVQGFETSRFLGDSYSQEIRVKSSRNAQIISGILYVASVALLMPVVQSMDLHEVKLAGNRAGDGTRRTGFAGDVDAGGNHEPIQRRGCRPWWRRRSPERRYPCAHCHPLRLYLRIGPRHRARLDRGPT